MTALTPDQRAKKAANAAKYRAENLEKTRRQSRESYHRRKHLKDKADAALRFKYGITRVERDAMLESQGGVCAICLTPPVVPHVDHNHSTGAVRSILCIHCNTLLGHAKEDPARLRAAIAYLETHNG